MKRTLLLCLCGALLSACFHAKSDPGRVGQMYFTTVSFSSNGQDITALSHKRIEQAAKIYKKNPTVQVQVKGYTDATGSERGNLNLSKQRADKVAKALQVKGIPAAHIVSTGYGSAKPIASNQTPEGRQQNRRVEIEFPYPTN